MKTPILSLLLLCGSAQATDWARITANGNGAIYIDKRSVASADEGRKAWTLVSYKKPQTSADGKTYRSVKMHYLYACQEHSMTLLAQTFYPETMARGEAVGNFRYEQYDAEKPAAGSLNDSAFKLVCRRRKGH